MLNVIIWDCTGTCIPILYKLQVCNSCKINDLKIIIECKRSELGRRSKKNFLIYHGNQLITSLDTELLSFITDIDSISTSGITFTIYDENIITCNIRIVRGMRCKSFKYIPLFMNLFKRSLNIELFDQENVATLKDRIFRHFESENLSLYNKSILLLKGGVSLEDKMTLKSIIDDTAILERISLDCLVY